LLHIIADGLTVELPSEGAFLCGVDEAGRGPLAGPVTAAAVILPDDFPREVLADSKVLARAKRERVERIIRKRAVAFGVGWASHEEIDQLNILQASLLAMVRAVGTLHVEPALILVDGNRLPDFGCAAKAVVRGDAIVPEIMAASILAKTARDRWMIEYAAREPLYLFEKHKGYPTVEHRRLIGRYGPSKIQRRSFRFDIP